jgi:hypothetical protein
LLSQGTEIFDSVASQPIASLIDANIARKAGIILDYPDRISAPIAPAQSCRRPTDGLLLDCFACSRIVARARIAQNKSQAYSSITVFKYQQDAREFAAAIGDAASYVMTIVEALKRSSSK